MLRVFVENLCFQLFKLWLIISALLYGAVRIGEFVISMLLLVFFFVRVARIFPGMKRNEMRIESFKEHTGSQIDKCILKTFVLLTVSAAYDKNRQRKIFKFCTVGIYKYKQQKKNTNKQARARILLISIQMICSV